MSPWTWIFIVLSPSARLGTGITIDAAGFYDLEYAANDTIYACRKARLLAQAVRAEGNQVYTGPCADSAHTLNF